MSNPSFAADYPPAIVYPAHPTNYRTTDSAGNPRTCVSRGFVLHTPEEPADSYAYTPVFFADPNRDASTHYFAAYKRPAGKPSAIYQCVPAAAMAIANGVIGKPYPSWANPGQSLNWQTHSCEIEGEAATIGQTFIPGSDQFNDVVALIKFDAAKYGYPTDREHVIGHYQVASNRTDPGAGFPWDALIAALNQEEDMAERVWNIDKLQTWIVGKGGAAPVAYPVDDAIWQALYGPHTRAMTVAELEAIRVKP